MSRMSRTVSTKSSSVVDRDLCDHNILVILRQEESIIFPWRRCGLYTSTEPTWGNISSQWCFFYL